MILILTLSLTKKPIRNTKMALARVKTQETSVAAAEEEVVTAQGVEETAKAGAEEVQTEVVDQAVETEVQEEAQLDHEVKDPEPSTQVAEAKQTAVAPTGAAKASQAMAEFSREQEEQGFEGMDLTGMSFDRIKLHEGQFKLGQEETPIGTDFECVIQATRRLYVVRQSDDNDADAFYSYDPEGKTNTDGSESKLEEWKEDGYEETIEIKEYMEAVALLVNRDDEFDQMMVMLSVPPASRARVAGAAAQAQFRLKAKNLSEVVVRASVGKQVGTGTKAFKPWNFSLVGRFDG